MGPKTGDILPYVGPRPFERGDSAFFFGRDYESPRIVNRMISNRAFLLYAQSGAGKTSILNTKIIPLLEENGFEVFPTSQGQERESSPLARVGGGSPSDLADVANIFIFNTLINWSRKREDVSRLRNTSLSQYLAQQEHSRTGDGSAKPRVIIFDQFEELFTSYPQLWHQQAPFFEQIKVAMQNDSALWIVFSIREDFIARLDNYSQYFEDRLRGRFRLELLRRDAALQAVREPMNKIGIKFDANIAETIVRDLLQVWVTSVTGDPISVEGEFVEPVQLQVICQSLWQNLQSDTKLVTSEFLAAFGGIDKALTLFYEQSIRSALQGTRIPEATLRKWFERYMITPMGTRGNIFRGPEKTGNIPNQVIDALQNMYLLRSEERAGARWYELAHDRFVGPIQRSNDRWESELLKHRLRTGLGILLIATLILIPALYSIFRQVQSANSFSAFATSAIGIAAGVSSNSAWTQVTKTFDGVEMVLTPKGCFNLGSDAGEINEQPTTRVCFDQSFWIDRVEVTTSEFSQFNDNPQNPVRVTDPNVPRTRVTWGDAESFCHARNPNSRLPTEAEWEYAARGPDALTYPWGNQFDPDKAVYRDNAVEPAPVGIYPGGSSWVGALDMSGNVWEWTHTVYLPYPYNRNDGRESENATDKRVIRGGSYSNDAINLRSARRIPNDPSKGYGNVGFRCMLPVEELSSPEQAQGG